MSGRPALTWEWTEDWAKQNKVTDDALVEDDGRGRIEFFQVSYLEGLNLMVMHHERQPGQPQITWGEIKRRAEELGIPGTARLEDDSDFGAASRIVDIGWFEAEPGFESARLVLQHRWG